MMRLVSDPLWSVKCNCNVSTGFLWGRNLFVYLISLTVFQLYAPSRTLWSASDTRSLQIPCIRLSSVGFCNFSGFDSSPAEILSRLLLIFVQTSGHFSSQNYGPGIFSIPVSMLLSSATSSSVSSVCLLPVLSCV